MAVIQQVMDCVRNRLEAHLQSFDSRNEPWVTLANFVDHQSSPNEDAKNKVVMFLSGIEHETIISTYSGPVTTGAGGFSSVAPTLYVNLMILFTANFDGKLYQDGLRQISRTISFFQQNYVFNHANMPDLDPSVDKLAFEFANLDMTQLNYLMCLTGTKYLPSVLYKVRTIPFRSSVVTSQIAATRGPSS